MLIVEWPALARRADTKQVWMRCLSTCSVWEPRPPLHPGASSAPFQTDEKSPSQGGQPAACWAITNPPSTRSSCITLKPACWKSVHSHKCVQRATLLVQQNSRAGTSQKAPKREIPAEKREMSCPDGSLSGCALCARAASPGFAKR